MVEAGANEIPEAEILDALDIAHDAIKKLCALQRELAEKAGKPKIDVEVPQVDEGLLAADPGVARRRARRGHAVVGQARAPGRDQGRRGGGRSSSTPATRAPRTTPSAQAARSARSTSSRRQIIRERIAVEKKRPDGRTARRRSARSRSRSASLRARTARRSSRAARRRPSASPRSAR